MIEDTTTSEMTVRDYLDSRYALCRSLRPNSLYQYRVAVESIERWSGEPMRLCDLTDDVFNRWLVWLSAGKIAPATVRELKGGEA
jgi:pyridoxine/pyridoxamine 5'-phosphate oxidase